MPPRHFAGPAAFRAWLAKNHANVPELWVGFYKKHTGRAGLAYAEAVDEALAFGWIDGIKKRVDDDAFMHRFTPRRARSIWSDITIRRVEALIAAGRMQPAGMAAYRARDPERSGIYSFERKAAAFNSEALATFKANAKAWAFFEKQPPGYRRLVTHRVMSAKRAQTRKRRLEQLIALSSKGLRFEPMGKQA